MKEIFLHRQWISRKEIFLYRKIESLGHQVAHELTAIPFERSAAVQALPLEGLPE
jgi:hypothetical protein